MPLNRAVPRWFNERSRKKVVDLGLEGVVAKKRSGHYLPGRRGWIKTKNRPYWGPPARTGGEGRRPEADGPDHEQPPAVPSRPDQPTSPENHPMFMALPSLRRDALRVTAASTR